MRIEHNWAESPTVAHSKVASLFSVDELPCSLRQHRDAQLQATELPSESILVVAPDSMASGYFLAQHPLTLIPIAELPDDQQQTLRASIDAPLKSFSHVCLGRTVASGQNRSLAEFQA